MENGQNRWQGGFQKHGYRLTAPRQVILDLLSKTSKHLSAEEIYFEVHQICPSIGLATVYRTLELLQKIGLVIKSDFGDGRARYEFFENTTEPKHYHLICINCGQIIDYKDFLDDEKNLFKRAERSLSKQYDFKITNHLIQFYGLCKLCQ